MRCPKCQYVGFEPSPRCKNCGYDLSLGNTHDHGTDAADAMAFASTMGIVEGLSHDLDAEQREEAMANLAGVMAAHETPDGVLLASAAWLITARRR